MTAGEFSNQILIISRRLVWDPTLQKDLENLCDAISRGNWVVHSNKCHWVSAADNLISSGFFDQATCLSWKEQRLPS
jgi:hypothetical protein